MAQIGELLGLAPFGFAPVTSSSPMNNQSGSSTFFTTSYPSFPLSLFLCTMCGHHDRETNDY